MSIVLPDCHPSPLLSRFPTFNSNGGNATATVTFQGSGPGSGINQIPIELVQRLFIGTYAQIWDNNVQDSAGVSYIYNSTLLKVYSAITTGLSSSLQIQISMTNPVVSYVTADTSSGSGTNPDSPSGSRWVAPHA